VCGAVGLSYYIYFDESENDQSEALIDRLRSQSVLVLSFGTIMCLLSIIRGYLAYIQNLKLISESQNFFEIENFENQCLAENEKSENYSLQTTNSDEQ